MTSSRFARQSDLIRCDMSTPITIIGAGGIGSFLTLTLAKMGFNDIAVYDNDTVEEHNLPNQFFREADIGKFKVVALQELVHQFTGVHVKGSTGYWTPEDEGYMPTPVLISAVDSMIARLDIFTAFKCDARTQYMLDGRMGGDQIEVYALSKANIADVLMYDKHMWPDADTSPVRCTSKATMYNVLTIAAIMSTTLRLMLSGEAYRNKVIQDNYNVRML